MGKAKVSGLLGHVPDRDHCGWNIDCLCCGSGPAASYTLVKLLGLIEEALAFPGLTEVIIYILQIASCYSDAAKHNFRYLSIGEEKYEVFD